MAEPIPVSAELKLQDWLGAVGVRLGFRRNKYSVSPGLYKIGEPEPASPVLVTANYKLTFDMVRRHLGGQNLWLLVLNTRGVNVWCAAGKGTFGTQELLDKIDETGLREIISHRTLILPQLGAPGVSAHDVARISGFKIVYGPVRAEDIPEFLAKGIVNPEMRRVKFDLKDRLLVTPLELVQGSKLLLPVFSIFLVWNLVLGKGIESLSSGLLQTIPYVIAWLCAGLGVPLLLPWLPFRSFALKGALAGIVPTAIVLLWPEAFGFSGNLISGLGNSLVLLGLSAFLALNFTGATTFTSYSGVKLETAWTLSTLAVLAIIVVLLLGGGLLFGGGIS